MERHRRKMITKEFFVQTGGWEKVKPPLGCRRRHHADVCLHHEQGFDFAYCTRCGQRTIRTPHESGAWAKTMLEKAEKAGEAFRDVEHLIKMHFRNLETGKLGSFLVYRYEDGRISEAEAEAIVLSGHVRWDGYTREFIGFEQSLYESLGGEDREKIISLMLRMGHSEYTDASTKGVLAKLSWRAQG